ncbi:MAG: membrane protein insertion efficiency factor YidD [Acidobacteria bacterium]|nr:MAG: membrane protein insertion efficiency factor YidD [Acidobacteriota bacterium]
MERGKSRRATLIAFAVVGVWVGYDLLVPPRHAVDARAAVAAIDSYRAVQCRFTPTCSVYGRESIRKYGLLRGGARTAWRLARCGPWTPLGTPDPP